MEYIKSNRHPEGLKNFRMLQSLIIILIIKIFLCRRHNFIDLLVLTLSRC